MSSASSSDAAPLFSAEPQRDLISRGQQGTNILGTTLFVTLRLLDGFIIQPYLLTSDAIPRLCTTLGISLSSSLASQPTRRTISLPLVVGGQGEMDLLGVVIWAMAAGSAVRQSFWLLRTANEPMSIRSARVLGIFNSLVNTLNTFFSFTTRSNPTWSLYLVPPAVLIYLSGMYIETVSESQRKHFKNNLRNKGKVYSDGLWLYARHINYFGYVLWRGGFALAAGGLFWGALTASFFLWDFVYRGVPVLDRYCTKKYGAQWEKVKSNVKWKMVPGLY